MIAAPLPWPHWSTLSPAERGTLFHLTFSRETSRTVWVALSKEINAAASRVAWANKIATRTGDSDIRIHYLTTWLNSLMAIARSLP